MKKIIEAIASNEHLDLYDRVSSKTALIDLKLETNKQVKIEDVVAAEVEKRLKALNINAQKVAQVQKHQMMLVKYVMDPITRFIVLKPLNR